MNIHQQRLKNALDSWPHWQGCFNERPSILKKINGGYTNSSYLVGSSEHAAVLRLNHLTPDVLGIDRTYEHHILLALKHTGIAPAIVYWPTSTDFAVLEYIDGRAWTSKDYRLPSQRQKLLNTISQYKKLSPSIAPFSYCSHLNRYWVQFKKCKPGKARNYQKDWQAFMKRLRLYEMCNQKRVLTHHDLVPENIIESNGNIRIIDWEYAGLGIAALDQYFVVKQSLGCFDKRKYSMAKSIIHWLDILWWEIR